jgi:WD40 repeat protein
MSAIFISHSGKDNQPAAEIRDHLKENGYRGLFLDYDPVDGIPAGHRWEEELYTHLRRCRAVIVICSKHSMSSPWCFAEITHGRALGKHIFPLKIDDCEVTGLLQDLQIIDVPAVGSQEAYRRLLRGLLEKGLDPREMFDWDETRPPYPGLPAFQKEDAAVFFGRDDEIDKGLDLLNQVRRFGGARLMLVLGASGSGKSSLVRAGILPRLAFERGAWLVVDPFRPAKQPLSELAKVLADCFRRSGKERDWKEIRVILQTIANDGGAQAFLDLMDDLRIGAGSREATVLLTVDQVEELFSFGEKPDGNVFLPIFRRMVEAGGDRLIIIGTLRSDFLGHFQQHPTLQGLSFQDLTVGHMPIARLRGVIDGPAEVAGIVLEDGLVEQVLGDAQLPDALPLLAFALRELWEQHGKLDRRLELQEYMQLGGLDGSIKRATDSVLRAYVQETKRGTFESAEAKLTPQDERDLRTAFLSMVQVNEEGQHTRKRTRWDVLPAGIHGLLQRLVSARLLISDEQEEPVLEVAHESLFRSWEQLQKWLDEDREFLLWRKRLQIAVGDWTAMGSPEDDGLLQGGALATARGWLLQHADRLTALERQFTQQSIHQDQRKQFLAKRRLYVAHMGLAHRLWGEGNVELMRELLEGHLPRPGESEQRGFEWYYLWRLCHSGLRDFFHGANITAVAFSGGNSVASAGADGSLLIWEVATGRVLRQLRAGGPEAIALVFTDEERLVSVHSDGRVLKWQLAKDLSDTVPADQGEYVRTAAMTSSGSNIALLAPPRIRVRDLERGEERVSPELESSWAIQSMAISPDGQRVALAVGTGEVVLWDAAIPPKWATVAKHQGAAQSVSFNHEGNLLASGGYQMTIKVTDLAGGRDLNTKVPEQTDLVHALAFSPDGTVLAIGTADPSNPGKAGVVSLLNVRDGRYRVFKGHTGSVNALGFSPDGKYLVSGSHDGTATVWDSQYDPEWMTLHAQGAGRIFALAFSPCGDRLATGSEGSGTGAAGRIQVWDLHAKRIERNLMGHTDEVSAIAFDPTGEVLLSGSRNGTVRLWDTHTWLQLDPGLEVGFPLFSVAFAADGKSFAAAGGTPTGAGQLKLWNAENRTQIAIFGDHAYAVLAAAFSPDNRLIAAAGGDYGTMTRGEIKIWDIEKKEPLPTLRGFQGWTRSLSFSPDGSLLATGSASLDKPGSVKLWNVATQQELATLKGHQHSVQSVAFSPDGKTLASGSGPGHTQHTGEVKLWDRYTEQEIITLRGYNRWVYRLAFSQDGLMLATVSGDEMVRLWSGSTDSAVVGYLEQRLEMQPDDPELAIKLVSAYWGTSLKLDSRNHFEKELIGDHLAKGRELLLHLKDTSRLPKENLVWISKFEEALERVSAN